MPTSESQAKLNACGHLRLRAPCRGDPQDARPLALVRTDSSTAIAGLIAGLLMLLSLLAGYIVWQDYINTRARAEAQVQKSAHVAAAYARWLIEANLQALRWIDDSIIVRDGRPHEARGHSEALPDSIPRDTWLFVTDREGNEVFTRGRPRSAINVADREYFEVLRDGAEFYISTLLTDRATNRLAFMIGRRIEREGEFVGAAIAVVPADLMDQVWASLALGPESTVSLLREDGRLVAQQPLTDQKMDLSKDLLFTRYLPASSQGFYHSSPSPADGATRIVGYRIVAALPLVTVVDISNDGAMSQFWNRLAVLTTISVPLAVALLAMSIWVAGLVRNDKRTRKKLAEALEQNQTLMQEIHHRVKNNLQAVSSLIELYPGPAEMKSDLQWRIGAIAALHEQIYKSNEFVRIELGHYIRQLVASLRDTCGWSPAHVQCDVQSVYVDQKLALPLALIISEVVGNAFKHAFPDRRSGTVAVSLRQDAGDVELIIRDDGVGLQPVGHGTGLGMRLLDAFSQQLGGTYEFKANGGTVFRLIFPSGREDD